MEGDEFVDTSTMEWGGTKNQENKIKIACCIYKYCCLPKDWRDEVVCSFQSTRVCACEEFVAGYTKQQRIVQFEADGNIKPCE